MKSFSNLATLHLGVNRPICVQTKKEIITQIVIQASKKNIVTSVAIVQAATRSLGQPHVSLLQYLVY